MRKAWSHIILAYYHQTHQVTFYFSKKTNLLKLQILFQPLSYVSEKVFSIPILICEHLIYNKERKSRYCVTFKKFWLTCFKIIWPKPRDGWYCLTYCHIKDHGSSFMFIYVILKVMTGLVLKVLRIWKFCCHLFWRNCKKQDENQIIWRIKSISVFEGRKWIRINGVTDEW